MRGEREKEKRKDLDVSWQQEINHIYFLVSAGQQILMSKVSGAGGKRIAALPLQNLLTFMIWCIGEWTYTKYEWLLINLGS